MTAARAGTDASTAAPQQDPATAQVAALLLVGAGTALTAAAVFAVLRRLGRPVSRQSVTVAVGLASARTKHQPRMVGRSDVARAQRDTEAVYRAAYVVAAAERIQRAVDAAAAVHDASAGGTRRPSTPDGSPPAADDAARAAVQNRALRAAARRERAYEKAHERARRRRMEAAAQVAAAADAYGPLLGWWAHDDDRTTPECRAADGTNFHVAYPPAIGWPGTPHGGTCRCEPGPPHAGGSSTDEATGYTSRGIA